MSDYPTFGWDEPNERISDMEIRVVDGTEVLLDPFKSPLNDENEILPSVQSVVGKQGVKLKKYDEQSSITDSDEVSSCLTRDSPGLLSSTQSDDKQESQVNDWAKPHDSREDLFTRWNTGEWNSPISPDDFKQYQQHVMKEVTKLRKQRDMLVSIYKNERSEREQEKRCVQEKKPIITERQYEFWKTNVLRARINEPVWPLPATSNGSDGRGGKTEKPNDDFLYDNPADAGREMNVRISLLRVHIAVDSKMLDRAERLVTESLRVAKELDYIPIWAKCKYWEGIVLHAQGRHAEATKAFVEARPCVGRYMEGEKVDRWLEYYYQSSELNSPAEDVGDSGSEMAAYHVCESFSDELTVSPSI